METIKDNKIFFIISTLVVAALILAGAFFFSAQNFSKQGSYFEVKGLSEKIVKADTAIWSLSFEVRSNNIDTLYAETSSNIAKIKKFLMDKGFDDAEINVAPINIYQDTYREASFRYNSTTQVSVYTQKVDLAKATSGETLSLIKEGIVLSHNYISFEFSDIMSIKPEMLAEAIKNARSTAELFAENAGSALGSVTRGDQGVFDISNKDPGSPEYKKIRLVSSLRFLLQ